MISGKLHREELVKSASGEKLWRAILTRVKLHHLRIFMEVARQESVSKAAKVLRLAQPAVSKTLGEFESHLDTKLFERRARGVVLNNVGELVLPHVQAVFADLAHISDEIIAFRQGWSGVIAVGATMSTLPFLLPECLANKKIWNSEGLVRVIEGTIDQMTRALVRGELDLVVGRVLTNGSNVLLSHEIVFEDPFVPVVGKNHPLAIGGPEQTSLLSNYPWVMPPFGSSATEPLYRYLTHHNIHPKRCVSETVSYQTIFRLLKNTDTVAILPQHLANDGQRQGTLAVVGPTFNEGSLSIGITCRKDRPLHPLGLAFCEAFRQAARTIAI